MPPKDSRKVRHQKIDDKDPNVAYTKQQIRDIFMKADTNGDDQLSWDEVKAAFAKLGAFSPVFRAWRGRSCADANNDGFISLSTELDELVNYTLKLQYKPQ